MCINVIKINERADRGNIFRPSALQSSRASQLMYIARSYVSADTLCARNNYIGRLLIAYMGVRTVLPNVPRYGRIWSTL